MPKRKKGKTVRVRIDRKLPKKLQLRHASLVARLDHAMKGKGAKPGTMARSNNPLVDAFLKGFECGQMGQLLEDSTQYLHDNWNDIPKETRDALEKQVVETLNIYANNC